MKGPKDPNSAKKAKKVTQSSKMCQQCQQKARNRDITHFLNKTASNFAKILPEIGFFYTNNVGTLVRFSISAPA